MAANDKVGVAIHGAGTVSSGHLRAYLRNPHCDLVAISSRTKDGAAAKAREFGLDPGRIALYDSVDGLAADPNVAAVSICTPHNRHSHDVVILARAGKHVLVEKPIAMNCQELES